MIQKLQQTPDLRRLTDLIEPIVLCAADDHYVRPLAVTLHSAAQNLGTGSFLRAIVLDGGISAENWVGLKETLAGLPIDVSVIRPGLGEVADLGISHHITHTAYLRLLAGRLLPASVDRAIYLDADLLVCDDLTQLWEIPLDGNYALAVPDIACPFVDMRRAQCNFRRSSAWLSSLVPIANWRELNLDGAAPYFNSGVMVLNIERMRRDNIERKLLACLRDNPKHVWCWDQYALNVVFAGQWKPLPLRWNQGAHVYDFPGEEYSPLNADEFVVARDNPSIIHYTTEWKPWDFGSRHPRRELFFDQLDQTAWRGWRPERPAFDPRKKWQQFASAVVRGFVVNGRRISARFSRGCCNTPAAQLPVLGTLDLAARLERQATQITLFSIPKPFAGPADIAQRNAIASWKKLGPDVEIVLMGNELGTALVAVELGVKHLPDIETNELGTPLISAAFDEIQKFSDAPLLAFCNCDVILFDDFSAAINRLNAHPEVDEFVAIGRRTEIDLNHLINFDSPSDVAWLKRQGRDHGRRGPVVCKEYFVLPNGLFRQVPKFAVGRGNWDNWLVAEAKRMEIPIVSLSDCVTALHQNHDYSHIGGSRYQCYVNGSEARKNQRLAGGRNLISGCTCDYRLGTTSLRPSRMKFANGEFWADFPRFLRLLSSFVGQR